MKTLLKIIKSIIVYFLFYFIFNIVFCILYYFGELNEFLSFTDVLICSLSNVLDKEIKSKELLLLLSIQEFVEMICATVLTGYIFAYILNREPQIILPNKLVIRHRTSENVSHLLTLGVLVGNKSRFKVHDVRCIVSCYYVKNKKNPILTNSEFQISKEVHSIDNYYRFSFELEKFPRKILQDFIDKESACLEIDTINISVSGHSNLLGNAFLVSKKYKLTDLILDEHVPQLKYYIKNPFTKNKMFEIVRWNELNRIEEIGEKKRAKVIDEIKTIIKKKSKI